MKPCLTLALSLTLTLPPLALAQPEASPTC